MARVEATKTDRRARASPTTGRGRGGARFGAALVLGAAFACVPDAGGLQLRVVWPEGRPDFEGDGLTPHLRAKVLDGGAVLSQSASEPLTIGATSIRGTPYRDGLRARVEILDGPWTNARILYAGETEPFDLEPGRTLRRVVTLSRVEAAPTGAVDDDLSGVIYERAPWGRLAEGPGGPEARVGGAPGSAPQDAVEAIAFSQAEVARAELLARGAVASDGSFDLRFSRPLSSEADRVAIAFSNRDRSLTDTSTAPGIQAAWARRTRWFANLHQKVLGSDFPNPHEIARSRKSGAHRRIDPSLALPLDGDDINAAVSVDDARLEAEATMPWARLRMDRPSPRFAPLLAYDEERGEMVLLWGVDEAVVRVLGDAWRWTDLGWRPLELAGGETPVPRGSAAFVHHRRLGGLVLFGGQERVGGPPLGDLWLLRGEQWRRLAPGGSGPGPRIGPGFAYDTRRGRLVVFGGCALQAQQPEQGYPCVDLRDDLWAFDGERWSRLDPAGPGPSARMFCALAYDEAQDRLLLFGGASVGSLSTQTFWALSLATLEWSEIAVGAGGPPPQFSVQAVFDPERRRLFLGSGTTFAADGLPRPAGLWAWDGASWSEPAPELGLGRLVDSGFAWHRGLGMAMAVGGSSRVLEGLQSTTLLWDGETGRQLGTELLEPALIASAAATDPERRWVVLFGGVPLGPFEPSGDTWIFDGVAWRRERLPGPGPRVSPGMVHVPAMGGVLMFGGATATGLLADAWLFDGAWRRVDVGAEVGEPTHLGPAVYDAARSRVLALSCAGVRTLSPGPSGSGRWIWRAEPGGPPPRMDAALVYDATNERALAIGGQSCATGRPLAEAWALSSAGWTQLAVPEGFQAVYDATATHDPGRGVVVVVGGRFREDAYSDQVWELEGDAWRRPRLGSGPPIRAVHSSAFEPTTGRILVTGGLADTFARPTILFDGADFVRLEVPSSPGPRCGHGFAYRPVGQEGLLFGGCGLQFFERDDGCQAVSGTWAWTGYDWRKATGITEPEPRSDHVLFGGPDSDQVLALGGRDGRLLRETVFSWNGRNWSLEGTSAGLVAASAAWDPRASEVRGFGGYRGAVFESAGNVLGAWSWSPAQGLRGDGGAVSPRMGAAVVYDEARDERVGFGGDTRTGSESGETCLHRSTGWTCETRPGPSPRREHRMVYDSVAGRVLLVGGVSSERPAEPLRDTWAWAGGAWHEIAAPDYQHDAPGLIHDPVRRGLVAHGGETRLGPCDDTTSFLDLDPDNRPEIRFIVDFGTTRESPDAIERLEVYVVAGARGFQLVPGEIGAAVAGGVVEGWEASRAGWRPLGAFEHDVDAPREALIEVTERLYELVTADGKLELRVRPAAGNGSGAESSAVALDAIEARIDYAWD